MKRRNERHINIFELKNIENNLIFYNEILNKYIYSSIIINYNFNFFYYFSCFLFFYNHFYYFIIIINCFPFIECFDFFININFFLFS